MPNYEVLADGSFRVTFPENGTSIIVPSSPDFQMNPGATDWHEYVVTATIPTIIQSSNGIYLTREDVERALLQQSAPEWQDLYDPDIDYSTDVRTTGSFTDTFGPGEVTHIVSADGTIIVNQTQPGHPFHPGIVVRTVVQNPDGSFSVLSYGLGNTSFNGAFGEFVAQSNLQAGMVLFSQGGILFEQAYANAAFRLGLECFVAGTPIDLWDGGQKPIEEIRPGDIVTSYDAEGRLVPGRVLRLAPPKTSLVIDFWGIGVTPGHVMLCGDGPLAGRQVQLIDILRSDGSVVLRDGSRVRAATGWPVGSEMDREVIVMPSQGPGSVTVRLGTRLRLADGAEVMVADLVAASGDAPVSLPGSAEAARPEAYLLARSGLTESAAQASAAAEGVPVVTPARAAYRRPQRLPPLTSGPA